MNSITTESQDFFSPNGDGQDETIEITVEGNSEIVNSIGVVLKKVQKGDVWDGTDENGVIQRSGVYLVLGDSGQQIITLLK